MKGKLFVITAPSGAGKTSLIEAVMRDDPSLKISVSYTTRPPRKGEKDGVDYHFVDEKTFRMILTQGLNRQIRRMCSALGYRVQHLRRVRIINIDLGTLAPGEWRELGEAEVAELLPRRRPASGGVPSR